MQFFKAKSPFFLLSVVLILLVAILSRFLFLDSIPYGINNDEAAYIYSAYSIWKTGGYALEGGRFPLSVNVDGNDLSPVPVYFISPFVGILGVSPFTARLPFILLSLGSIFLVFLISRKLFTNDVIALLSMFVMSIAPWHIFISRSATDANVALFFYLLGLWLFLKNVPKGNSLYSLPIFFLAFFSYHATKIFFIFLIPVILLFYKDELLAKKKQVTFFIVGILVILFSFGAITKTQGVIRQNILVWNDPTKVKEATTFVNTQRNLTRAPLKVSSLYTNKYLFYGHEIVRNYLGALSPQFLFVSGDPVPFTSYAMFFNGEFYLVDLVLLFLGLYFLFAMSTLKKERYLLLVLIAISAAPSAFAANTSYVIRSIMLIPFLSMLIGIGIYQLVLFIKGLSYVPKMVIIASVCFLYLFFISQFLYQYFFQFAVFGGDSWYASSREVASQIKEEQQKDYHVYVGGIQEKIMLLKLGIFLSLDPKEMRILWNHNGNGVIGDMTFYKECLNHGKDNPYDLIPGKTAYFVPKACYTNTAPIKTIVSLLNGQEIIWKMYEKQ